MSRDNLTFLLQHLGFAIKKLILKPSQQIKYLGLKIDTLNMNLVLTKKKMEKVILKCQNILSDLNPLVRD